MGSMLKKDTVKRYILFQIPELIITLLVLIIIRHFYEFPFWIIIVVMIGSVLKDVVMFHYTWTAYIVHSPDDYANVKGKTCVAVEDFEKKGMVRINAELWKARTDYPVQKGDKLVVENVKGLELFVRNT